MLVILGLITKPRTIPAIRFLLVATLGYGYTVVIWFLGSNVMRDGQLNSTPLILQNLMFCAGVVLLLVAVSRMNSKGNL